jgi:hypothetical protein
VRAGTSITKITYSTCTRAKPMVGPIHQVQVIHVYVLTRTRQLSLVVVKLSRRCYMCVFLLNIYLYYNSKLMLGLDRSSTYMYPPYLFLIFCHHGKSSCNTLIEFYVFYFFLYLCLSILDLFIYFPKPFAREHYILICRINVVGFSLSK